MRQRSLTSSRREFLKATSAGIAGSAFPWGRSICAEDVDLRESSLVRSVRYLGPQFVENPVGISGHDCASSIQLPSGESLWIFGDTVEGTFESMHDANIRIIGSNTAAIVPPQDVSLGISSFRYLTQSNGNRPREIVPVSSEENSAKQRIWPIHGACVEGVVYLFYHRITILEGADPLANFQLNGMGIAKARIGEYQFTRLAAPDGAFEFWKGDQPGFGVFVELVDNYFYLWGSRMTGMYLARTRPDTIEQLENYEYLTDSPMLSRPGNAPRWSKTFDPNAVLFDSVPNEMSAAFNPHLGRFVAVHMWNRENRIVMRTAPRITGPWSKPETVFRPTRNSKKEVFYAAKEHPELARDGGRILYVTYIDSTTYIPKLIEVELT
jgi:hypothetical protein